MTITALDDCWYCAAPLDNNSYLDIWNHKSCEDCSHIIRAREMASLGIVMGVLYMLKERREVTPKWKR